MIDLLSGLKSCFFLRKFLFIVTISLLSACGGEKDNAVSNPPVNSVAPAILLNGSALLYIEEGSLYQDAGATATDAVDGTVDIIVTGEVDTSTPGEYIITYTATDKDGNSASISRKVVVSDNTVPVITLIGNATQLVALDATYVDPGATAEDNVDGELQVVTENSVDTHQPGQYLIRYTATDSSGNVSTVNRTVEVVSGRAFITVWKTDNEGASEYNQIQFSLGSDGHDYVIDWGDGRIERKTAQAALHTYDTAGVYTVAIYGGANHFYQNPVNSDAKKLLSIEQWGDTQWVSMSNAFNGCEQMVINAQDTPDLNLVTDMSYMFNNAKRVVAGVSQWNVSNVINMAGLFAGAERFNGDVREWNVSNVKDMAEMFAGATDFNADVGIWDVSQVENMAGLFAGASSFTTSLDLWQTGNVTTMARMFEGASSFNARIDGWNVSKVTDMNRMFKGAGSFSINLDQWDVSAVTDMSYMFSGVTLLTGGVDDWNVSNVTNMSFMFEGAENFYNVDLNGWNVSAVTTMEGMFKGALKFNSDISNWNVSAVNNMDGMFEQALVFNADISRWDVSGLTSTVNMFRDARSFNQDLSGWDVSGVVNFEGMFASAVSFNADLVHWDVSAATNMNEMFKEAASFNADLSAWDVSSVTTMDGMFNTARQFSGDISSWDVSSVTSINDMFANAHQFNADISGWDVSGVTSMERTFSYAIRFLADISAWDISNTDSMKEMFKGHHIPQNQYDAMLNNWASLNVKNDVVFGAGFGGYSTAGQEARDSLVNDHGWLITDGGYYP